MKKYLPLCMTLTLFTPCLARIDAGIYQSKTFMWTRPAFLNMAAEQAFWHDFIYNKPSKGGNSVQIKSMYQKSLPKKRIKQYFLFGCSGNLLVTGDDSSCVEDRNVRAEWLGIPDSQFSGRMTIDPEQRQTGFSFTFHKDISTLSDLSMFQDYWVSVELPIFAVRNSLNLTQYDINFNGERNQGPTDLISAFNQKCWHYAKIPNERSNLNAVGLLFKFGRAFLSQDHFQVVYYSTLNIPFGDGQNPEYLFDAYLGTNRHFGMGAGANFQVLLNQDASRYALCWFLNLEQLFLMRNKQLRTFDLKGKPWSRYMLYNRMDGPANQNIPGVNILTLKSRVRPYNWVDFSTGWRFMTEHWDLELGYDLWGHGNERVEIRCNFPEIYGIAGDGATPEGKAVSASKSTICHRAENDTTTMTNYDSCTQSSPGNPTICQKDLFVPVTLGDIDETSAEAQSAINHKVHIAIGYVDKGTNMDGFFGFGGSLEFPQKNSALHLWNIWFKVGASR